jgi:NAD(P)-dependent dehydrogenase (short-subunit alcohol dehydrogenase family)
LRTLGELPREEMKNWFYLPGWKQVAPQREEWGEEEGKGEENSCWLLLMDETGLGRQIAEELRRHKQRVVEVRAGSIWKKEGECGYVMRAEAGEDYGAVLQEVQQLGWKAKRVVHMWTVGSGGEGKEGKEEGIEEVLKKGMYSLLYLAQGLERQHLEGCEITIVTTEMQGITAEERVCAEKGTLLGPCRIIPVEYQKMNCRCIDVKKVEGEEGSWEGEWVRKSLVRELVGKSKDRVVVLRGHQRWVEAMEAIELWEEEKEVEGGKEEEGGEEREEEWMRRGGVYMVTGGLGGIGLGMAEYLAEKAQAKLVLVGRTGLPGREEWERVEEEERAAREKEEEGKKEKEVGEMESSVSSKIRRVRRLEELGGEVLVVAADVGNEEEMRAGVREAVKRFGTVHGVMHAAGVPGIGLSQLKTPEMLKKVMRPKVEGTLVLEKVMKEEGIELDFLVLFSSVASLTGGGPGQFDYCAANAFLDGYAQREARRKRDGRKRRTVVSIDWGEWQWNAWSEGLATVSEEIRRFFTEGRKKYGITFEEGRKALGRIVTSGLPQVVVSTQDFRRVFEATKVFTAGMFDPKLETGLARSSRYRRPDLKTVFAAPGSKVEKLIGGIWEEFLGIAPIGIHDNFFELGGNSLIALQVVARLRQASGVDLPVSALLANPSISAMAVATELSIIEKIERMSEETAQNLMLTASATAKS